MRVARNTYPAVTAPRASDRLQQDGNATRRRRALGCPTRFGRGARVAWIAGSDFGTGTIEAEIRGKDVLQRSFVGIAFAGANDSTYELVYFRPFNFRAADSTRHAHAIQYVADPDYPWARLRRDFPGRYEKPLAPAPDPNAWVSLRLVVTTSEVRAYVDGAEAPNLVVGRLRPGARGRVGLWVGTQSDGDFANVRVSSGG